LTRGAEHMRRQNLNDKHIVLIRVVTWLIQTAQLMLQTHGFTKGHLW